MNHIYMNKSVSLQKPSHTVYCYRRELVFLIMTVSRVWLTSLADRTQEDESDGNLSRKWIKEKSDTSFCGK